MARIILIGNYPPDRQESMERFAQMLATGFRQAGAEAEIWRPAAYLARRAASTTAGLGKWLGYVDKWLIFPLVLRWRLRRSRLRRADVYFHVCDHSNAPYLAHLPADRTAITCHDVLAIRGALGYADAHCPASSMGKLLQKWILRNLLRAQRLACVSELTLTQLRELRGTAAVPPQQQWQVIHNALNASFEPASPATRAQLLRRAGLDPQMPYLLHVGSGLPRKNRRLLLDMAHALGPRWSGRVCYAGQTADDELLAHAEALGLGNRVSSVAQPDHATLVALYSACDAFVFPSLSEGFGWPVIEAQACGAPVVASNIEPMPEVSGGAALHVDPTNPQAFAEAFLTLQHDGRRAAVIEHGVQNSRRFELRYMTSLYLALHGIGKK